MPKLAEVASMYARGYSGNVFKSRLSRMLCKKFGFSAFGSGVGCPGEGATAEYGGHVRGARVNGGGRVTNR